MRTLALIASALLSMAAHATQDTAQSTAQETLPLTGRSVVLLGDDLAGVLMRDVAARERSRIERHGDVYELVVPSVGISLRSLAPGGAITALADALHHHDIGLIVVDATRGPTPVVREHMIVARQARTPMLALMFANVERLYEKAGEDSDELLDLEFAEIRELLAAYELDASSVPIFYDARPAALETEPAAVGIPETLRALSLYGPRRTGGGSTESASEIWAAVYLLSDAETAGHSSLLSPNDTLVVWSEGAQAQATLASRSEYNPGDFREMPLAMDPPLGVREGSRLLLVRGERVVGLGVVTQIGR